MKSLAMAGALMCLAPIGIARASETVTYTYDELGRLVTSSIQSGPNSGTSSSTAFDPLGNRSTYSVGGSCTLTAADNGTTDEFSAFAWVNASGSCALPVTIAYSTQDGTGIAGTHYQPKSGTISLTSISSGVGVSVSPIYGSVQGSELKVFYVNFSVQSGNATFADAQSAITVSTSN